MCRSENWECLNAATCSIQFVPLRVQGEQKKPTGTGRFGWARGPHWMNLDPIIAAAAMRIVVTVPGPTGNTMMRGRILRYPATLWRPHTHLAPGNPRYIANTRNLVERFHARAPSGPDPWAGGAGQGRAAHSGRLHPRSAPTPLFSVVNP